MKRGHPISRYIENEGITQAEFARRAGITPQQLHDVINGRSYLGRHNSLAVTRITRGSVTLEQLIRWPSSVEHK